MSPPPSLPKRSGNKLVLWIVLSGGLLVMLSFVVWRVSLSWQVRSKLAALRQAGYPVTPQELERKYYAPVDPASNAAPFFNLAFAQLRASNSVSGKVFDKFLGPPTNLTAPFSAADASNITTLLADNREALDMLHQTPTATVCRFPLDFSLGPALQLPQLQKVKDSSQLLSVKAVWDASQGKTAEAVDDLDASFRVIESLKDEPIMISQLVRVASTVRLMSSLERVLTRQALTDSQLSHLADEFKTEEHPAAMEHALAGDLCTGTGLIFQTSPDQVAALGSGSDSSDKNSNSAQMKSRAGWGFLKLSGFTARDFNFYLTTISQYLATDKLPFPQKLEAAQLIEDESSKAMEGHFYLITSLFFPAVLKCDTKEATAIASLHDAQTALAIERFRLANQDRLPEKLSDLAPAFLPAVPTDPFNGEPLHYKKLATGYEVYSVGPNRKDDGGVKSTKSNGPDDIAFTVER